MSIELQASVDVDLSGITEFSEAFNSQWHHQSEGPITKAFRQWAARYRSFIKERYDTYSRGGGDWKPLSDRTKWKRRKGKLKKPSAPKLKVLKTGKIVHTKVSTRRGVSEHTVKAGKRKTQITNLNKRLGRMDSQRKYKGIAGKFRKMRDKSKLRKQIAGIKSKSQGAKRKSLIKANKKAKSVFAKAKKDYLKKGKFSILRDTNTMFTAMSPTVIKPGSLELGIVGGMRVGYGGAAKHPTAKITIAAIAAAHQTGAGYLPVRKIIVPPDAKTGEGMTKDMMRGIRALGKLDADQLNEGAA